MSWVAPLGQCRPENREIQSTKGNESRTKNSHPERSDPEGSEVEGSPEKEKIELFEEILRLGPVPRSG